MASILKYNFFNDLRCVNSIAINPEDLPMFRFFPTNYPWDLSINLALMMGAEIGEIQEMCGPLAEAAKQPDAEGTAAFRQSCHARLQLYDHSGATVGTWL